VDAWYAEIKRRCDWSDYKLDCEFAWTEVGKLSREDDIRPRTFEWIRKVARKPRGMDKRWRGMKDLVLAVDQHRLFRGTGDIYNADVWDLLQEESPILESVQERINRLLTANGLVRVPAERAFEKGGQLLIEFGLPTLFDHCILTSLRQMDRFSRVALVWCLYVQAEPAHNAPYRAVLQSIADALLDRFFADCLLDRHRDYYAKAIGTLLQTRMDLSSRHMSGYGVVETLGTWPVVPKELVGKLTKAHIASELWI
jgi:hypothetical protein